MTTSMWRSSEDRPGPPNDSGTLRPRRQRFLRATKPDEQGRLLPCRLGGLCEEVLPQYHCATCKCSWVSAFLGSLYFSPLCSFLLPRSCRTRPFIEESSRFALLDKGSSPSASARSSSLRSPGATLNISPLIRMF